MLFNRSQTVMKYFKKKFFQNAIPFSTATHSPFRNGLETYLTIRRIGNAF